MIPKLSNKLNNISGFWALIFGTAIFGIFGVYSRLIGIEFGIFNQMWVRNIIVALLVAVYCIRTNKWQKIAKKDRLWFVIWPLIGMFVTVGLFVATIKLSIGTAMLLFYVGMIIANYLASRIMFGERINSRKLVSMTLAFTGLIIIYGNNFNSNDISSVLSAIIGGACNGIWGVISKKMSKTYNNFQLILIDSVVSAIFGIILAFFLGEQLRWSGFELPWLIIALWATTSIIVIWTVLYGFKKLEAQKAALVLPMRAVFGAIWGYLIYQESLGIKVWLGGVFIIFAAMLPNLRFAKHESNK